jgi:hypothetical protein
MATRTKTKKKAAEVIMSPTNQQSRNDHPPAKSSNKNGTRKNTHILKREVELLDVVLGTITLILLAIGGALLSYHWTAPGIETLLAGFIVAVLFAYVHYRHRYKSKRTFKRLPFLIFGVLAFGLFVTAIVTIVEEPVDVGDVPRVEFADYNARDPAPLQFIITNTLGVVLSNFAAICVPPGTAVLIPSDDPTFPPHITGGLCARLKRSANWRDSARRNQFLEYRFFGTLHRGQEVTIDCHVDISSLQGAAVALGLEFGQNFWGGLRQKRRRLCLAWLTHIDSDGRTHLQPQPPELPKTEFEPGPGGFLEKNFGNQ